FSPARGEEITIKLATVAPEGSAWAREFRAFQHQVERTTSGRVHVKWYLSGVAGDESEELDRIQRGQLDGAAFGLLCERVAPTGPATRLPGVFQNVDEAAAIMNLLRPDMDKEAHQAGFVILSSAALGPDTLFLRQPVRDLDELRKVKLWRWDIDQGGIELS